MKEIIGNVVIERLPVGFANGFEEMKAGVISLREENKQLRSALVWLDSWLGDKPMPECVKRIKDALRPNAVAAERAAKIARDMADHEAGITALRNEIAELRAALYDEHHGISFHLRDAERQGCLKALADCVASLRGYRRELSDGQPCDAEKAAVAILTQNVEFRGAEPIGGASPATKS